MIGAYRWRVPHSALAGGRAKLFDVSGNAEGFNVRQVEPAIVTPVEKLFYRARVRRVN
jgi:hypothetical protein